MKETSDTDEKYMLMAIEEAKKAKGAKRVGAVAVKDGVVIARAHNTTFETNDPVSCAESNVISMTARKFRNKEIDGTTIYTTMESCLMCIGVILKAKVDRVVFGMSHDEYRKLLGRKKLQKWEGHFETMLKGTVKTRGGVLKDECRDVFLK